MPEIMNSTPALDQIIADIEAQAAKEAAEAEATANGTVIPPEAAKADEGKDAAEVVVYQKVVEFADGTKQTFEGATPEEVVEKVVTALKSTVQPKVVEPAKAEPRKPLTDAEEFEIGKTYQLKPTDALKRTLEAEGVKVDDLRETVEATRQLKAERDQQAAISTFNAAHPDYYGNPEDNQKIGAYIQRVHGGTITAATLEEAYTTFNSMGLLKNVNPAAPVVPVVEAKKDEVKPEEKKDEPVVPKRQASGLFGKGAPSTGHELAAGSVPTEEQLAKMSAQDVADYLSRLS